MYNLRNSSVPVMFMHNVPVDDTQYMRGGDRNESICLILYLQASIGAVRKAVM